MKLIAETERLLLRELVPDDAAEMFALNADPEVIRHTGDPPFRSIEEARAFLIGYDAYRATGMGRWAVIRRDDGAFLGWCGLKRTPSTSRAADLGFRLHRRWWGQGYATESAAASLEHGFGALALERVIGRAREANGASVRVLEKLGFSREGDFDFEGHPGVLFSLQRASWWGARAP